MNTTVKELKAQDQLSRQNNTIIGRYFDEPIEPTGFALYKVLDVHRGMALVEAVEIGGIVVKAEKWGNKAWVVEAYVRQRINNRDKENNRNG